MRAHRGILVLFAKRPVAGRVKTRMSPPLTPEQAAEFYIAMLQDALEASSVAADSHDLEPVLAVDPPTAAADLSRMCPPGFRVVAQRGADLSQRMAWAVAQAAASGATRILLRGSDSPTLDADGIGRALEALDEHDLVVCPDRDGGYNLIGLRGATPGLFDHAMSTASVLDDTLANAERAGLRAHVLPPGFDLDTVEDLRWLADAIALGGGMSCRRTVEYADMHDLWRLIPATESAVLADPLRTR
jgi:rSAM/selenodomain-associated transferase 1